MIKSDKRIEGKAVWTVVLLLNVLLFSCVKSKFVPVEHYPDPPPTLVKFLDGAPNPAIGAEGSVVTYPVTGLKGKEGQFKFFINQTEAEVVEVQEAAVKVKVPANASTGGAAVLINGEYYFGPTFTVRGKVTMDPLFNADAFRSNGTIEGILPVSGNSYLLYGSFSNYNNRATATKMITGLTLVDVNGAFAGTQLNTGKEGLNGPVSSVLFTSASKYLVAGSFTKYDTVSNINNLVRLNNDGTLETTVVDVINPDPVAFPDDGKATVPSFNGGTLGSISKLFTDNLGRVIAIGNFQGHISTFYERSTKAGPYLDRVQVRQLLRMNSDGSFDSTFNFNKAEEKSYAGGNGFIYDAVQLSDGKVVLVGNFSTFSGKTVNYLTAINMETGLPDESFNNSGSGADGAILRITYNKTTRRLLLTGQFKHYNGQEVNGVVMIKEDGSIDPSFNFRTVEGGFPNFAGQLNNGKVLVSGSFTHYNGIVRPGMVILNADGSLAQGYNNLGLFRGQVNAMIETPAVAGVPTVILVGSFDRFDNKQVGNLVKFRIEN
ncbi:DUF5008 domain-containing protein [Flavisolibacter sp. BT320]|nr:DUF5008 domain-containing protein [Flavisolibacter longurius]